MDFSQFHFENNAWLWGIAIIPAVLLLYGLFYKGSAYAQKLEHFVDKHLLPHLLKDRQGERQNLRLPLLVWSLAWACGMIAMAGPRWDYTEVQAFKPDKDLVIVLDLSTAMNAQDVKPSRIVQARERIEDLLNMSRGITIGLVAYAAVPHMIVPLTDDTRTIHNLLPALDTSLVTIQGDRLKPALEMASRMLEAEPGNSKSILVISNGGFEENDMADLAQAANGASIYTMGVGTVEGAPVADENGGWVKDQDGKMLISHLQADRLQALSAAGHGFYVEESYSDSGIKAILSRINGINESHQETHRNVRIWQERFYIPALALALLLLPLFRKRYIFPVVLLMMSFSTAHAEAASWTDLFLNQNQQGQKAYNQGDYKRAMEKFNIPYQHGVAAYKAGQFDQAAQSFKAANGLQAEYNLGNAQLMQGKAEEAIISYESVLKQAPNDASTKHNLEIARKILQQQKQQQQDKQQSQKDQKESAKGQAQNNTQNSKDQSQKGQEQSSQQKQANGGQDKQQNEKTQNGSQGQKQESQSQSQKGETVSAQTQQGQSQQGQDGNEKDKQQQGKNGKNSQQQSAAQNQPQGNALNAQAQAQKEKGQQPQNGEDNTASAQSEDLREATSADSHSRTQTDINADQWLDRIQNDPGSFLKNQFMIEDRASGLQ